MSAGELWVDDTRRWAPGDRTFRAALERVLAELDCTAHAVTLLAAAVTDGGGDLRALDERGRIELCEAVYAAYAHLVRRAVAGYPDERHAELVPALGELVALLQADDRTEVDAWSLRRIEALEAALLEGPAEIQRLFLPLTDDPERLDRVVERLLAVPHRAKAGIFAALALPIERRDTRLLWLARHGTEDARLLLFELLGRHQELPEPGSLRLTLSEAATDRLLLVGVTDPHPRVRRRAIAYAYGLARLAPVRWLLLEGGADADAACRAFCLVALGLLDDPDSRERLERSLVGRTDKEVAAAVWALARRPDGVGHVVAALDDPRPTVRDEAIGALLHVAAPLDEVTLQRLEKHPQAELQRAAARNRRLTRPPAAPSPLVPAEEIERLLGRPLDATERGGVWELDRFPPRLLEDVRRLPDEARRSLLRLVTAPSQHRFLDAFIDEVVARGAEAARWRRGGALAPKLDAAALVGMPANEVLELLPRMPGQPWQQVDPADHAADALSVGAPAVDHPQLSYRDEPPTGTVRLAALRLRIVDDPPIAVRRWMVARLAAEAARLGRPDAARTADPIAALWPGHTPSADARIAAAAWRAETARFSGSHAPAGFRGPDAWYAGLLPA